MMPSPFATSQGRIWLSAGISLLVHGVFLVLFAFIAINFSVPSPEFVELNIGRISQRQLTRMIQESEQAAETAAPDRRARTPQRRLPKIDMPVISPTEAERRLVPEQVSLDEEKFIVPPTRPAGPSAPPLPAGGSDKKVLYEGAQINLGPRPGEGIESEHVGSDIQPVFLIEGDLTGRRFYEAAVTEVPDVPAQTRIQLDLTVAPSGAIISTILARRENAALEAFATSYLRRCRFDPLPVNAPQVNQTGRITITFAVRP